MRKFTIFIILALIIVLPCNSLYGASTDLVPPGHRSYSFINYMINQGLVNGYSRGFTVVKTDRDTMAKYISFIFEGKTADEIVKMDILKESDLSTLSELIDEFIMELSSQYSAKLSVLLEKSMTIRNMMDQRALQKVEKRSSGNYSNQSSQTQTKTDQTTSDSSEETGIVSTEDQPLPTGKLSWEEKMYNSITFRSVNTKEDDAYNLNNAEKKAGYNLDANLSFESTATDDFGEAVIQESAYFEAKNSDLYDYYVKYANLKDGMNLQLGYKLRPDITEYTFRGEELKGLVTEFNQNEKVSGMAFFGKIRMDNEASDEVRLLGFSSKFQLSNKYATRLTLIKGQDINRVASIEQIYRPDSKSLHEFEFVDSNYLGLQDHAYEYRWKQAIRRKLSISTKYKNLGENYSTVLNPSLLSDIRKSDLRYLETVINYKFTPFIFNTTTLIHSNENNSLQTAPIIPIDTNDYTTVFISAVPKKPKYMVYLKDQHKTGFDSLRTSTKDDKMKLALFKVDHKIGKFYPRVGYTYLKLDYSDLTINIPVDLDTTSKTMTYGWDYNFNKRWNLKFDYQITDSDSTTQTTTLGVTTISPSNSESKVYNFTLEHKFNSISNIIYTWYKENRSGSEDVRKISNMLIYSRRLRKDLECNLLYEKIKYTDAITTTSSYDSDEFALTFTHSF